MAASPQAEIQSSIPKMGVTSSARSNAYLTRSSDHLSSRPAQSPTPRTSTTHPLNVSFIIPPELLIDSRKFEAAFADHGDLLDYVRQSQKHISMDFEMNGFGKQSVVADSESDDSLSVSSAKWMGNICLASCPGKKVRLNVPNPTKAATNRDIFEDFARLASLGVKCVVNCLNDADLRYLGAPWKEYQSAASRFGISILRCVPSSAIIFFARFDSRVTFPRLPIIEGAAPDSLPETHALILKMDLILDQPSSNNGTSPNILIHCRGGIGRAGLIACCYLLYKGFIRSAARSIDILRIRRSTKAIETRKQEDFIFAYEKFLLAAATS